MSICINSFSFFVSFFFFFLLLLFLFCTVKLTVLKSYTHCSGSRRCVHWLKHQHITYLAEMKS